MRKWLSAVGVCLLMILPVRATSPTVRLSPTKQLLEYDTSGATAVGTSTEDVFTTDIYLTYIRLRAR